MHHDQTHYPSHHQDYPPHPPLDRCEECFRRHLYDYAQRRDTRDLIACAWQLTDLLERHGPNAHIRAAKAAVEEALRHALHAVRHGDGDSDSG